MLSCSSRCVVLTLPRSAAVRARAPIAAAQRFFATESAEPTKMETRSAKQDVFEPLDTFLRRHVGPRPQQIEHILEVLGYKTMDDFINETVPEEVRLSKDAVTNDVIPALSESELAQRSAEIASQNKVLRSFIGMGYNNTLVPPVIMRNVRRALQPPTHLQILENPGWYTSYTPYQAEISQGTYS